MDEQLIRIMLIDNNHGDIRLVREMLAEAVGRWYYLRCRDCLSSGLEFLINDNIAVVLCDLGLPDSQGIETLARVRTEVEIPVVVLTSLEDESTAEEAVLAGAQDYLVKGQVTQVAY
ncbi:response regulator [Chloroflexota bacterium]